MELPKIINGTSKQIVYAEKIRKTMINKLTNWINSDPNNENCETWKTLLKQYKTRQDATWFIEWRNGVYQGQRGTKNYL